MSRTLMSAENYSRLLDSAGTAIVLDGSGNLKVSGNLDVRALTSSDVVTVDSVGSTVTVTGSLLTLGSITNDVNVTATELDIRPLTNTDVVTIDSNISALTVNSPVSSSKLWDAAGTGANGDSAGFQPNGCHLSFYGNLSGATTISLWLSDDSTNWYMDINSFVASGSTDMAMHVTCSAKYVRLRSSNDVTATIWASSR